MIYDINHSQVSPNRLNHHLLDFMQVRSVPFSRLASISAVLMKFWWRQYFQERANPIVAKINCTKATQSADLLTRAAIDMRYVAGDLSSWADETTSPRADIKRLINRLDNCIAKLLAIRRATSSIMAARELAHEASKSAGSFRPSRLACVNEFAQGRNNVAQLAVTASAASCTSGPPLPMAIAKPLL